MTTVDYDPISSDLAILLAVVSILAMASLYVEIWDREAVKKWLTKYLGAADPLA